MSLYTRVHTPNSPLLPLSPIMPVGSPSNYLSPYTTSIRSRRSFTPSQLNFLPPPSVSPIRARLVSNRNSPCVQRMPMTPQHRLESSLILSSSKESIKKIRSSARKMEVRNNRVFVPLSPIRRSLFGTTTPAREMNALKPIGNVTHFRTPPTKHQSNTTPKRSHTPHERLVDHISSPWECETDGTTPNMHSILEETFTVMSILKEIKMQKYASLFASEEVDLFVFLMLDVDDMVELGIEEADRPILLNAIHCYTDFFGSPEL